MISAGEPSSNATGCPLIICKIGIHVRARVAVCDLSPIVRKDDSPGSRSAVETGGWEQKVELSRWRQWSAAPQADGMASADIQFAACWQGRPQPSCRVQSTEVSRETTAWCRCRQDFLFVRWPTASTACPHIPAGLCRRMLSSTCRNRPAGTSRTNRRLRAGVRFPKDPACTCIDPPNGR